MAETHQEVIQCPTRRMWKAQSVKVFSASKPFSSVPGSLRCFRSCSRASAGTRESTASGPALRLLSALLELVSGLAKGRGKQQIAAAPLAVRSEATTISRSRRCSRPEVCKVLKTRRTPMNPQQHPQTTSDKKLTGRSALQHSRRQKRQLRAAESNTHSRWEAV